MMTEVKALKKSDKFWMSAYSGIPSDDNDLNKNNLNTYDVQELTFKYIDAEMFIL